MNAYEPSYYPAPPRLLLGLSLMAWGGLNNHALIALGVALLVESSHWLNWRWRFGLRGYARAWILSLIALAGTVAYHSLNLIGPSALLAFLEWLPLIFLPLMLAQQYGEEKAVPTSVFSVIARRRLRKERSLGKSIPESRLHLGYPYFTLTLLATAFPANGMREQWVYFGIMLLLASIALYYANRSKQRRLIPWLLLIVMLGFSSMSTSRGLVSLYFWVKNGGFLNSEGHDPPEDQITAIGKLGELKLSRRIEWRLSVPPKQRPPELVMTLAYNDYHRGKWQSYDPDFPDEERSYSALLTTASAKDKGEFAFVTEGFSANEASQPEQFPIRIRGAINNNRKAIPSPHAPVLFAKANEIDSLEQSQLGTIVAINANSVVDFEIRANGDPSFREAHPTQRIRPDGRSNIALLETTALAVPSDNKLASTLFSISQDLQLDNKSDAEKVDALKIYFSENFRYTTHLKIAHESDNSALRQFLTAKPEGHCEYFATATTLLLRAAGVPAHYVVGFAVREKSNQPGEYLLRGTHAHAWCRAYLGGHKEFVEEQHSVLLANGRERQITLEREVWVGGQWTDIDLTPGDWLALDSPKPNWRERMADRMQNLREDFQLWRANESNRGWVNLTLGLIALALLIFVVWRLSGSRVRQNKLTSTAGGLPKGKPTLLTELLPKLEQKLGARPQGETPSEWLPSKLPKFPANSYQRLFDLHDHERFSERSLELTELQEFETLVQRLHHTCTQNEDR